MKELEEKNIDVYNTIPSNEIIEKVDTLVLGYFLEQLVDSNLVFGYQLIEKFIERDKDFIVWDNKTYNFLKKTIGQKKYKGEVFFQQITYSYIRKLYSFSNFPSIKTPVLCVVGTGSFQGKFTCQIIIRDILMKKGYKI